MGVIRVLPDEAIEELFRTAIVVRIACCAHGAGDDARPYLAPLALGYDGAALYGHTGPGRKLRLMRANPLVTVEVDRAEAGDRWQSALGEGVFEEIHDRGEQEYALRTLYPAPAAIPDLGAMTIVFRIRLTAKSGRYETPD